MDLTPDQLAIIEAAPDARIFLQGPAGCGKTTAGVERMLHLMQTGIPGSEILLVFPQRTLAGPYYQALQTPGVIAGGLVTILTVGGLARRMLELFWPLVSADAGFAKPDQPPTFLTLETAQYYMAHLVRPLLEQGFFNSVTIDRNRLYSQILDNLNKAAVVGFPHSEIGQRLDAAWVGDPGQARIYQDAQHCANLFRDYCLEHNLLDFSLQMEIFLQHLWHLPLCRDHLQSSYRHLIVDNVEEDTPAAHDLLLEWLPDFDSALVIYDQDAGYRRFLGADPESAYRLKDPCRQQVTLDRSFVATPALQHLGLELVDALYYRPAQVVREDHPAQAAPLIGKEAQSPLQAIDYQNHHFFPQMMDWVAARIAYLVHEEGIPPGEIAVLAPFLSDALRFALTNRLEGLHIPVRSHRPSRSLREEPATRCMLTLAALAHPEWELPPAKFDLVYALIQAIGGLDLVRAQLLVDIVYRVRQAEGSLSSFDLIRPEVQARITYLLGERFERLRLWLEEYRQSSPLELDHFLSRLFGEVLSQPGFDFHGDFIGDFISDFIGDYIGESITGDIPGSSAGGVNAGEVAANLIESIQKFRWAVGDTLAREDVPLGREYLLMVQDGVIAAQYIRSWQLQQSDGAQPSGAVLLAPAYTFLMSNQPVLLQFWLDAGSQAWFERLYQPLTHPYVLSRNWPAGKIWSADDELSAARQSLSKLVLGLTRRSRGRIILGLSDLNEQGFESRGPLLLALQRVLRQHSTEQPA